jgi:hypothetical protein
VLGEYAVANVLPVFAHAELPTVRDVGGVGGGVSAIWTALVLVVAGVAVAVRVPLDPAVPLMPEAISTDLEFADAPKFTLYVQPAVAGSVPVMPLYVTLGVAEAA